jgi:hypothetical protein
LFVKTTNHSNKIFSISVFEFRSDYKVINILFSNLAFLTFTIKISLNFQKTNKKVNKVPLHPLARFPNVNTFHNHNTFLRLRIKENPILLTDRNFIQTSLCYLLMSFSVYWLNLVCRLYSAVCSWLNKFMYCEEHTATYHNVHDTNMTSSWWC